MLIAAGSIIFDTQHMVAAVVEDDTLSIHMDNGQIIQPHPSVAPQVWAYLQSLTAGQAASVSLTDPARIAHLQRVAGLKRELGR